MANEVQHIYKVAKCIKITVYTFQPKRRNLFDITTVLLCQTSKRGKRPYSISLNITWRTFFSSSDSSLFTTPASSVGLTLELKEHIREGKPIKMKQTKLKKKIKICNNFNCQTLIETNG